jgi:hypothetical protein
MKLQKFDRTLADDVTPDGEVYSFWCPGCEQHHLFAVRKEGRPSWTFDGNMQQPTFSPSLLYPDKTPRCHLFLRNGKLEFCSDCEHELAGKTVDLPDIPEGMRW